MKTRSELKAEAREKLGGGIFTDKWLYIVLLVLIIGAIMGLTYGVGLILTGPIMVGVAGALLAIVRGQDDKLDFDKLFNGFKKKLGDNIVLGLLQFLFIFLWSLLFVIPGIVKAYQYAFAFYISHDNPSLEPMQCLEKSKEMTKGHKMELFILDLSFIGWYIVGALCLGVGTLWVSAYHTMTRTLFYREIEAEQGGYISSGSYTNE